MLTSTNRFSLLAAAILLAASAHLALCQGCIIRFTPLVAATPTEPMPAYEVATIKPIDSSGFGPSLRMYIQQAFGISPNTTGSVIGPDWINSEKLVINGRPPDALRIAMQSMTNAEQQQQTELMQQSLLADRFQFKAHFETREVPLYELTIAKGGPKLKEADDPKQIKFGVNLGSYPIFQGTAPINSFIDFLQCSAEIGGRRVLDKTGLTGAYQIAIKWSPMQAASSAASSDGAASPPDTEGATLFTAIEEQLGLKLIPTKGPGEVLVIDHIEQPSPN